MRAGQYEVSYQLIEKAIGLPPGNEITAVIPQTSRDIAAGTVRVVIEGDEMPKHHKGSELLIINDFNFKGF